MDIFLLEYCCTNCSFSEGLTESRALIKCSCVTVVASMSSVRAARAACNDYIVTNIKGTCRNGAPDKRRYPHNVFSYFSMKTSCGYSLEVPR